MLKSLIFSFDGERRLTIKTGTFPLKTESGMYTFRTLRTWTSRKPILHNARVTAFENRITYAFTRPFKMVGVNLMVAEGKSLYSRTNG